VDYEPAGQPSLFDRWEQGADAPLQAPLAVADSAYRAWLLEMFASHCEPGSRVISVGAGNGCMESALRDAGWDVLATDPATSALGYCRAKGLATARYRLGEGIDIGPFDAIYCDGVLGHTWEPASKTRHAWQELGRLGHAGSVCLVSNDLADDDESARFVVNGTPGASFYRPPAGDFGHEAIETGKWSIQAEAIYRYSRRGSPRRRELLVTRLLVDKRVKPEDIS